MTHQTPNPSPGARRLCASDCHHQGRCHAAL